MVSPVFLDFHIHTSQNPTKANEDYDLESLKKNIEAIAADSDYLVSLTDHNFVNKKIYLEASKILKNILLGVELHIRNYDDAPPYHCHILFNLTEITAEIIDDINEKLDFLYPKKVVKRSDIIPKIEEVIKKFDDYEFLLLPHGGQNHSTFDISIPEGVRFDDTLEKSIYYNYFDGFTARSNEGLEKTHNYFERLGIKDVVNLVTATDNYFPEKYPDCKAGRGANDFVATWMLAEPTFDGLRLSLSESSRLKYGPKPDEWSEYIQKVNLKNENIDISINLTSGLNVVIGGSSSGKSLLVDSIVKCIRNDFSNSPYLKTPYVVENISVVNPSGLEPHYFDQSFIAQVCNPKDITRGIEDIIILRNLFPDDLEESEKIARGLSKLAAQVKKLVDSIEKIEGIHERLKKISRLSHLIVPGEVVRNPLKYVMPSEEIENLITYTESDFEEDSEMLDRIDDFLTENPLVKHNSQLVQELKIELKEAFAASTDSKIIKQGITKFHHDIDKLQQDESTENARKTKSFQDLLDCLTGYDKAVTIFNDSLAEISAYKIQFETKNIVSMDHKLSIANEFELTKDKFLEVINTALRKEFQVANFSALTPECLFKGKCKLRDPKIKDYDSLAKYINNQFQTLNKKKFRITTSDGRNFDDLSAGWKTSVILDLILGWDEDLAPLIIDQPEDNLATSYINKGLLDAIKKSKSKRQIIIVSHNATIPILGDAQNIIMCENKNNFITIRANVLEGTIGDVKVLDLIAQTADGGKPSIKKRVKKYNLKNFRVENEASI